MVRIFVAVFSIAAMAAGCAPQSSARQGSFPRRPQIGMGFTATSSLRPPQRSPDCHVDIVLDGSPSRSHVEIGRIAASWIGRGRVATRSTDADVLRVLRRAACRAGAHALYAIETSVDDHYQANQPRSQFARTMRAAARVAVYVSRDGDVDREAPAPRREVRRQRAPGQRDAPRGRRTEDDGGVLDIWGPGLEDPWAEPAR